MMEKEGEEGSSRYPSIYNKRSQTIRGSKIHRIGVGKEKAFLIVCRLRDMIDTGKAIVLQRSESRRYISNG